MDFSKWTPCRKVETYKFVDNTTHIIGFDSIIKLNATASKVWKMSDGKHSIKEIVNSLKDEFNGVARDDIEVDVTRILEQLNKKGVIVMNWDPIYKNDILLNAKPEIGLTLKDNEKIDIVLVQAPSANPGSIVSHRLQGMPPLGLGYLASWLKHKNYKVKILDLYIDQASFFDLENIIKVNEPKIIAISTTTETYKSGLRIASLCKQMNNDLLIVMGGSHVTFEYQNALLNRNIDIIARFEGEIVLENICKCHIRKQIELKDVKGICYMENSKLIKTEREEFINDLNSLPFPDRKMFNLEKYAIPGALLTSRGCVGNCIFCAATALSGGKYRVRSADNIMREMIYLKGLGVPYIQIVDDTMTADVVRLHNILNLIISSRLNTPWGCESRVDIMTKELLLKMKQAGCIALQFGVEAGNQKMLDSLKKNISIEQIRRVFLWCNELDIRTGTCLMIGQPYDTHETILDTIKFASELQSYGAKVLFSVTTPYPGTYLYNQADKFGIEIVERDFDYYNTFTPVYNTKNFTVSDVQTYYYDALISLSKTMKDEKRIEEIKKWNKYVQEKAGVLI
jgi:radical SAM superfamily enzyme YgiQ (UPF0313 family)